uniref:non-specific serine/threonine protein kinase n=1 Tax=Pseudonaja textilis TaxID=8673 RepID=A0A670ZF69_PSETE
MMPLKESCFSGNVFRNSAIWEEDLLEKYISERDRQRKLAEVRKHERVGHHPNCVNFVQAWEERGQLYIQTELCPGTLLQYCEEYGPLSEWQVQAFLWDMLQGLRHLHDRNLLHMDIKPANIFVSSTNVCKLGDFGLMLELDSGDLRDAQEGDPQPFPIFSFNVKFKICYIS